MWQFGICQELFENWDWERQCRFISETGYTGIEIAPFTLGPRIGDVSGQERQRLKETAERYGLQVIGLHWLLARTEGFHLTSPDAATRGRTAAYLRELAHACADLGGDVLVLGSPQQRNLGPDTPMEAGLERAAEVIAGCCPALEETGVRLCLEPLGPQETNFLNTCRETVDLIERVGHPRVRLHQDVKAMLTEAEPIPELIRRFAGYTAHFHVNDSNKLGPGMGDTDFTPILTALRDVRYEGWVSVEVFDYSPGCERIARDSLACLRSVSRHLEPAAK